MNRDVEILSSHALTHGEYTEMKALYDACFPRLRASQEDFRARLALGADAEVFLAYLKTGEPHFIGYAVVYRGALLLLVVAEPFRGLGVGSALLARAEARIFRGHDTVTLGHEGGTYLLTGVPADSPGAWDFFVRRGYARSWTACDLTVDLRAYRRRPELCYPGGDVVIRSRGDTADARGLAKACGDRIDEGWGDYYANADGVIVAERGGEFIGAVIAGTEERIFSESLPGAGELGCLGVLDEYREKGIGASLCSAALDRLAEAGVACCFIGYTWLDKWYGKFGAVKYVEYVMGEKRR